jgi:cell division protein FtsI/penicillin-binding protein 2
MGQEVGVTALQLASALSVIANGGELMKPYIVKDIVTKQGDMVKAVEPTVVRRVISEDSAARMRKILIGVVENGTGKLAKGEDFTAGGKTGTAQKIEPNGTYSHSKYMASFIGFAPAQDPQLTVVVTVDEPHPYYFGGVVAATAFKNLVSDTLKYLQTKDFSKGIVADNAGN